MSSTMSIQARGTMGISPADFSGVLHEPDGTRLGQALHATFYWDFLYPSGDAFCEAINRGDPRAVARLVQAIGLFSSARLIGPVVWLEFPNYKRFIHPVLAKGLARVWQLQRNLGLI